MDTLSSIQLGVGCFALGIAFGWVLRDHQRNDVVSFASFVLLADAFIAVGRWIS